MTLQGFDYKALKMLIKDRGWTQQDFADKLKLHLSTVTHWFSGIKTPSISTCKKIAKLLKVKLRVIIKT